MIILSARITRTTESILNRRTIQRDPSLSLYSTSVSPPVFVSHFGRNPDTNVLAAMFTISVVTGLMTLA